MRAQSCPTLCVSMDYSQPGSSLHGVFPARRLEWVVISFFKGSSQPRNLTQVSCVSCIPSGFLTTEPLSPKIALLLLLLSRFSHVRLCAMPQTAAHQAPPSLRFSRQEHQPLHNPLSSKKLKQKFKTIRRIISNF